jgi:hypothetical protein
MADTDEANLSNLRWLAVVEYREYPPYGDEMEHDH